MRLDRVPEPGKQASIMIVIMIEIIRPVMVMTAIAVAVVIVLVVLVVVVLVLTRAAWSDRVAHACQHARLSGRPPA